MSHSNTSEAPFPETSLEERPAPAWSSGSLENRVALITGSSRGIGAGIAREFARRGARVVIHGLEASEAESTAAGIRSSGGEARVALADLTLEAPCRELVKTSLKHFGRLDILVNNAGIFPRGNIETTSLELWDRIFALNLRAPFILCQEAVRHMAERDRKERPGACIINIGSVNAHFGLRDLLAYSSAKAGLTVFTRNLASDLLRYQIRVNQINPGWTLTEGEHHLRALALGKDWLQEAAKTRPFGRLLSPEDVAHAAVFFATDGLITGSVLDYEQVPVGAPHDSAQHSDGRGPGAA